MRRWIAALLLLPALAHLTGVIASDDKQSLTAAEIINKHLAAVGDPARRMFNSISLHNLLTEADSGNVKFEAKGMKKLHGRPAYVVEVKRSKASPMRLYFDAEDFMWVRTDYGKLSVKKPQGPLTNDVVNRSQDDFDVDFYIETSDFRTVDGVKLPFKFEQVATYPILQQRLVGTITGVVKQYIHNLNIDPNSYK